MTASEQTRSGRVLQPAWVVLALVLVLFGLTACGPIFDSDVWWHLRNGELLLSTHSIPSTNSYSWTAAGKPWVLDEWGFDVVIAMIHRVGGLVGLSLFRGFAAIAIGAMVAFFCRRAGASPWSSTIAAALSLSVLFVFVVERPWTLSFLLLPLTVVLARRALDGSRGAFIGTVLTVVVWANVHFAVVLGPAVVSAMAVGYALENKTWRRAAVLCVATIGGSLVNPYGISLYTHVLHARADSSGVRDWAHLDPRVLPDAQIFAFILAIGAAVVLTGRWRKPSNSLPLLLLGLLSLDALRNGPFLVILGAPELALAIDARSTMRVSKPRALAVTGVAAWIVCAAFALSHAMHTAGEVRRDDMPTSAVGALPTGCRLFNEYTLGGFVEWYRPDVPVSMDGRNDFYGIEQVNEQIRVLSNAPSAAHSLSWLDQHQVGCVLVPPTSNLAKTLETHGSWRLASRDPSGVLFVRG